MVFVIGFIQFKPLSSPSVGDFEFNFYAEEMRRAGFLYRKVSWFQQYEVDNTCINSYGRLFCPVTSYICLTIEPSRAKFA
jgi:hypothetical protein